MDNICKEGLILPKFRIDKNPYYMKSYVELYLDDTSEMFEFELKKDDKRFYNLSIKKPIPNTDYFDLETVYGFGGYYSNVNDRHFVQDALRKYSNFCKENNIIAEFIRFDPFNDFPNQFPYSLEFLKEERKVVIVDLAISDKERFSKYSSTARNIIRKRPSNLVIKETEDIDSFIGLYYATMRKHEANEFYFFSKSYFEKLINLDYCDLYGAYIDNIPISMAFFLKSEYILYYHLSASNESCSRYNPSYHLLHEAFNMYSSQGYKIMLLGGGTTSDPNDRIFFFKTRFSKDIMPYYIGGKIFDMEIYNKLINQREFNNNRFLRYRYE